MTKRHSRPIPVGKKGGRKASVRKLARKVKKAQTSGRRARRRYTSAKRPLIPIATKRRSRRSKTPTAHTAAQLAAAIAEARANAGLSQGRLARAVKSDQANIVRLEKGRSLPSVRTLLRIAKATGHELTITFER